MRLASFRPDVNRRADLIEAFIDHLLSVDLVRRCRKQALGHHILKHLRHHAVLADERESFSHRDHGAAEHGVVGEFDRGRRFGPGAGEKCASTHDAQQRLAAAQRLLVSGGDDAELSGGREIRPAQHGRGHEMLTRRRMARFERAHRRHAVRAHDQMDGAGRQRVTESALAECDLDHCRVLDEHRDDDVAAGADVGDRRGRARAGSRESATTCDATASNTARLCPPLRMRLAIPTPYDRDR